MEKNSAEILRDIEAALASLKERVRELEDQIDFYRETLAEEAAAEEAEDEPEVDFDVEIGVDEFPAGPVEVVPGTVPEDLPAEEPVDMVVEDLPEPVAPAEPTPAPAPVSEPESMPAPVVRPETERLAWRLDKPGAPVKNIRSGISLYDRALFIGTLFKEDYALYDKTISDLNALSSLDEAVDYLMAAFPDWNLKSDIVYSFMMAVRKKLG